MGNMIWTLVPLLFHTPTTMLWVYWSLAGSALYHPSGTQDNIVTIQNAADHHGQGKEK